MQNLFKIKILFSFWIAYKVYISRIAIHISNVIAMISVVAVNGMLKTCLFREWEWFSVQSLAESITHFKCTKKKKKNLHPPTETSSYYCRDIWQKWRKNILDQTNAILYQPEEKQQVKLWEDRECESCNCIQSVSMRHLSPHTGGGLSQGTFTPSWPICRILIQQLLKVQP